MSSTWWFVLQVAAAALGAAVFWVVVISWLLESVDRWWQRRRPGPHAPR